MPKFDVTVQLSGQDGNAFNVMRKVREALKSAGATQEQVTAFGDEATSSDYDHLLRTCMKWVNVQ